MRTPLYFFYFIVNYEIHYSAKYARAQSFVIQGILFDSVRNLGMY